ncbi:hypothetical protein ABIE18_001724, partial [Arthrobacter sp. 2762]
MGSIGDILARRAAMSGATLRPRRLPRAGHSVPANAQAGWESPTAAVTDSENARAMALLRGIEPRPFSAPGDVEPKVGADVVPVSPGLRVSPGLDGSKGLSVSHGLDGALGLEGALADSAQALE